MNWLAFRLNIACKLLTVVNYANRVVAGWTERLIAEAMPVRKTQHEQSVQVVQPQTVMQYSSGPLVYCAICSHNWRVPTQTKLSDAECPECTSTAVIAMAE